MRKYGIGLLLAAGLCEAADFFSGMAARAVIGQRTFTAQTPGASDVLLGGVGGIAYANGTLIVVDDNRVSASPQNNRVLIFRNVSSFLPEPTAVLPPSGVRCPLCVGQAAVVLGQPDFKSSEIGLSDKTFQHPTAVATDGQYLAVADTDNNRVLIWNSIPAVNQAPADVVLGQPDFKTNKANEGNQAPTARSLRGPQGVWIQAGRLYVADTLNNRILVWRNIPTQNFQQADLVLGQSSFTASTTQDLKSQSFDPKPNNMLAPVSVTSDGLKLFVADLGHNRVLVWNSIPDTNQAPADLAIGQPDLNSGASNNTQNLCPENRTTDKDGNTVYPASCSASLDFPRSAYSDGKRLFVADGGNDRVLVFNSIPTQSGQGADAIVGQVASGINQVSDSANPLGRGSADSVATPMGITSDGTNLFVSDPYRRRVMVFTPGETYVPYSGVRNLFSRSVYAVGTITFSGTLKEGDKVTVHIGDSSKNQEKTYDYTVVKNDSFTRVVNNLVLTINADGGDPLVLATPNTNFNSIILTSRLQGDAGNTIPISTTTSDNAVITAATSGATLSGGQDAAKIAPGTLVAIFGDNLSDSTASAPAEADPLPTELAGVQVYFDGIRAPLLMVSPTEIRAQVPWEVSDSNSISNYVRIQRSSGVVVTTAAVAVPVIGENPGLLAQEGTDPRPAIAVHSSSQATATVSVDGSVNAGDVATVFIEDRSYAYTVQSGDTLESIRDALIGKINANADEKVEAFAAGLFTRIRLRAKVQGPEGNGIPISTSTNEGSQVILTATNSATCCANVAGAPVTIDNPAIPGETIIFTATGLGLVTNRDIIDELATGFRLKSTESNTPGEFVSSLIGGKTANVLYSGLQPGMVGIYRVELELNSDIPTNPNTQVTIAQDVYVSNIVTIPVFNPAQELPPPPDASTGNVVHRRR
ncbi:MAG: hypothetical protein IT166_07355 [Bryobacterales bacterium]|nr:hypothetical protein [Bryobacterales bacterium]